MNRKMVNLEEVIERYEKIVAEVRAAANKRLLLTIIQISIEDEMPCEGTIAFISKKLKVDKETTRQYFHDFYNEALNQME